MPPPTLSYGLNLASNKRPSAASKEPLATNKRKKTIFDSDSESDDGTLQSTAHEEITTLGGLVSPNSQPQAEPASKRHQKTTQSNTFQNMFGKQDKDYTNLSSLHSSNKYSKTATSVDSGIYEYDSVYDSIHSRPAKPASATATAPSGPKYMTSLLRSAEVRKRDQLRARDKLLAREREAEGDEFADKEKFVTAAYKAQQEEVKRIEAEEAVREKEEEARRKKGLGMMGFYKDMLERDGRRHEEAVKAAGDAVKTKDKVQDKAKEEDEEKSSAQVAAELNSRGANIIVNDEGEVVDKRQLLSAGLNVAAKPKSKVIPALSNAESREQQIQGSRSGQTPSARSQQRARQTEMVTAQLEERMRKEQEEEEVRAKELVEKTKSKKTENDVMSARERYLARKREREQAKS
ncbi:hypothetical protein LOZ66_000841 [Ophidiomyces ophidiicola]|nr:hypothetical protein LOZ65_001827 [Ophidiomyces ophidiicola]KAI1942441.1 hypothetical protein LOZ66_000841 [Ophidiomyces ophidiicola]